MCNCQQFIVFYYVWALSTLLLCTEAGKLLICCKWATLHYTGGFSDLSDWLKIDWDCNFELISFKIGWYKNRWQNSGWGLKESKFSVLTVLLKKKKGGETTWTTCCLCIIRPVIYICCCDFSQDLIRTAASSNCFDTLSRHNVYITVNISQMALCPANYCFDDKCS